MLPRQDFCGRHESPLVSVQSRQKERQKSNHRLPGSHIPLDKPGHHKGSLHICFDLFPHFHLRAGQPVGKRVKELTDLLLVCEMKSVFRPVPGLFHAPQ